MMRYTGPTTRLNRRFKTAIFPVTNAYERKPYLPGIHGSHLRRRMEEYALGLNEKQKCRYMFGVSERQFRLTFKLAKKTRGLTGENFLRLLELRLDNIVFRMGFAKTRSGARQMVVHGHIKVDGHKVNIPSYRCKAGMVISVHTKAVSRQLATRNLEMSQGRECPSWLSVIQDQLKGTVDRIPVREEMVPGIDEQLIVGYYSR